MPLAISTIAHLGIRVADGPRAEAFYEKLGFVVTERHPPASVIILRNEHGIEINLIVNADRSFDGTNVLMDAPPKRAGYTHVALGVASMTETVRILGELRIPITEGPVKLGDALSLFVRDPDLNVIELREQAG